MKSKDYVLDYITNKDSNLAYLEYWKEADHTIPSQKKVIKYKKYSLLLDLEQYTYLFKVQDNKLLGAFLKSALNLTIITLKFGLKLWQEIYNNN